MRIKVKRYMKQRVKVLLSVVLALMMVLSMLPYMSLVVRAANSVSYINADGTTSTHDCTVIDENFQKKKLNGYSGTHYFLEDNWYYVKESVTLEDLYVYGDVHLILGDGATLNVTDGVKSYQEGSGTYTKTPSLTIYSQSLGDQMGTLRIENGNDNKRININGGPLTINGGNIYVKCDAYTYINTCDIIVNNGTLTANTKYSYGAIGWNLTVADGLAIKAGDDESSARIVSTLNREKYVWIGKLIPVSAVEFTSPSSAPTILGGEKVAFTAQISPSNATDRTVIWSVDNNNVKLFSDENCTTEVSESATSTMTVYAKGISAGSVIVKATSNTDSTKFASCNMTVHVHDFTLTSENKTITATCTEGCPEGFDKSPVSLAIAVPTQDSNGAAVITHTPEAVSMTLPDVEYAKRGEDGTTYGEATSTVPTEKGFYKASITLNSNNNTRIAGGYVAENSEATVSVEYGVSCIEKDSSFNATTAHGDFTVPTYAAVGATIQVTVTPEPGYQLNDLTAQTEDEDIVVTDNSFTMPDKDVTMNATFTPIDYTVTLPTAAEHGTVTADKTTQAHVGDTITLTVGPQKGYGLQSISVTENSESQTTIPLTQASGDGQTGEGTYTFTMPADNVTVNVAFAELTLYTVFYRPSSADNAVCRFEDSAENTGRLEKNAAFGNISCWAGQFHGADGRTSFPIAFRDTDNGEWSTLAERPVVEYLSATLNEGEAVVVKGEQNAFLVSFLWGNIGEVTEETPYKINENEIACYFVTANAPSLTPPDKNTPQAADGYRLSGWEYVNSPSGGNHERKKIGVYETLPLTNNITRSTIVTPLWEKIQPKLTYDLNGGSWNLDAESIDVTYGTVATAPSEIPTRDDRYVFDRWVVEGDVTQRLIETEKSGTTTDRDMLLTDGTAFDFENTKLIESITIRAEWKHVHAYVRMQISDPLLNGQYSKYSKQEKSMHLKICADLDDYSLEAHTFDSKGMCACGYRRPPEKFTLSVDENGDNKFDSVSKKDEWTAVTLSAAEYINNDTLPFQSWWYRSSDDESWKFLSWDRCVTFTMEKDMQLQAQYESFNEGSNYLRFFSRKFGENGLLFQLNYYVPKNWTVIDAGVVAGNNKMVRYFKIVDETHWDVQCVDWNNNAVVDLGEDAVLNKMYSGKAMNVTGNSLAKWVHAKVKGNTGRAIFMIDGIGSANRDRNYYGLGYVQCRDPEGGVHHFIMRPLVSTLSRPENSETWND